MTPAPITNAQITHAIRQAWPCLPPEAQEMADLTRHLRDWDRLMDPATALEIAALAHSSVLSLRGGTASADDLANLAVVGNMALLLAEQGYGAEAIPDIQAAQHAIVSAMQRHERTGRVGCTGPELVAISELAHIHDAQLSLKPAHGDLVRASRECKRRMRDGALL